MGDRLALFSNLVYLVTDIYPQEKSQLHICEISLV